MRKKQWLFWNPGSGKAVEIDQLRECLDLSNTQWVELDPELDLFASLTHAVTQGCETVITCGGDGTVNAIVNAMMMIDESQRPSMAIIPLGTANDFAGSLGIPDFVPDAVALLHRGPRRYVDLVRASGHGVEQFFANVAAGGNSVRVSEELTDEIKARWGAMSYLRGSLPVLADMESFHITIQCDGERIPDLATWALLVANGKTNAGRIMIAPDASVTDGLMDVIVIRDGTPLDMLQIVAGNLSGNFLQCEQVLFRQVKKLVLASNPAMRFAIDGEVSDILPTEFEVVPAAIEMLVGTNMPD